MNQQRKLPWGWIALIIALIAIIVFRPDVTGWLSNTIGGLINQQVSDKINNSLVPENFPKIGNPSDTLQNNTNNPEPLTISQRGQIKARMLESTEGLFKSSGFLITAEQISEHSLITNESPTKFLEFLKLIEVQYNFKFRISAGIDFNAINDIRITNIEFTDDAANPVKNAQVEIYVSAPMIYSVDVLDQNQQLRSWEFLGAGSVDQRNEVNAWIRQYMIQKACNDGLLVLAKKNAAAILNDKFSKILQNQGFSKIKLIIADATMCVVKPV